jgi:MOSC domain-containing protein YiiM
MMSLLERALSLYSAELIDALRAEGHPIVPGAIGENVTIHGLDWRQMQPAGRLQLGELAIELTAFASPCSKI